ncbi:hypothetical protein JCGZ_08854 [Jatropha curcas]|uniref:Gamma-interferon-inducible lysosomal thiol reductase n=1 Tax=Jatropha curcas TaxID=180498 RepID=A0A067JL95_JATCU|nr:gamma-interferon-responsive lysosomal thiol protein [Jatropha curcas]KDP20259.1 hypothetical protein JCGZ_08854 [Jatropha curcas]
MGSRKVLCFSIYSSLLFLFVSCSRNKIAVEPAPQVLNSKKVALSLYYETLCPYCRNFIVVDLAKVVKTDLMSILDLKLIPWGNAIRQSNNTIICQHGEDECYLNTIHACIINILPDVMKHFKFIKCIEEQSSPPIIAQNGAEASWKLCAQQLKFSSEAIKDCYDSGRGKQLLLQYGSKTDNLNPPHKYVPWVVVNETPLLEDYGNFVAYVCKSYKGKPTPKACGSHPSNSIYEKMSNQSFCSESPAMVQMKKEPQA